MRLSSRSRKLHDPWGNNNGNCYGQVVRLQYMVGASCMAASHFSDNSNINDVNKRRLQIDKPHRKEYTAQRFVLGSKYSVERLRR